MAALPDPPVLPMVSFTGGIRCRPLAWGGTWPLGHLEFTVNSLRIWGLTWLVSADRNDVVGIRFRPLLLSSRVSVVFGDGNESSVYFVTTADRTVKAALRSRGWPIIES